MLQYFAESRWYTIVGATAFYAVTSYWLLYAADEHDLITNADFIYWLAVTASTVGYGDLSPVTPAGKLVVALYVIPLGLSIFAMVIGRIAAWVSLTWKKGLLGMNSLMLDEHILVIGWNEQRTMLLLDLILQERDAMPERPDIVLCVKADITNPMPGVIEFVKVDSFNKDEDMDRACVSTARTILIDNPQDDVTMTTALYCTKRNPDAHQVAYFDDDSLVSLLQDHCPKVECTPSVAIEMLVKAAFDPGSSMLHHDLLSIEEGQAQFSVKIPESSHAISVAKLFINLKRKHDAIFIGYAPNG
ncbi:MAG TPA: potassium channel protein, partial [Alteromonas macleodii]|nr:potassium channel protein [Alteromonas macleodii]